MFARTDRLLLRPAWAEDANAVAAAIADEAIVRNLASAPWPYHLTDAKAFIAAPHDPALPRFLITRRTSGAPEVIGATGLARTDCGEVELGYWIAKDHWGQGYATEAAAAVVEIARDGLRLKRLIASHFVDNPASGRVLEKLGFEPTGDVACRFSQGRGQAAPAKLFDRTFRAGPRLKLVPQMIAA